MKAKENDHSPMTIPTTPEKATYLLDTRGYVILRGAFSPETIHRANSIISNSLGDEAIPMLKFAYFHLDDLFLDMMQHPMVLSIVQHVVGDYFRMDHAFGVQQTTATQTNIHGGRTSSSGAHLWLSRGKRPICHGQLSCVIALNDQGGDMGGICMLPGSHHSWWPAEGYQIGQELFNNVADPAVFDCPELHAGDVMLFPECIVHGNTPWQGGRPRRSLYYMYFPGHSTWRSWSGQQARHYDRARNDFERRMLRAPSVGNFDDTGTQLGLQPKHIATLPQ